MIYCSKSLVHLSELLKAKYTRYSLYHDSLSSHVLSFLPRRISFFFNQLIKLISPSSYIWLLNLPLSWPPCCDMLILVRIECKYFITAWLACSDLSLLNAHSFQSKLHLPQLIFPLSFMLLPHRTILHTWMSPRTSFLISLVITSSPLTPSTGPHIHSFIQQIFAEHLL